MSLAMSEAPRSTWSADVRARVHFAHVTVSGAAGCGAAGFSQAEPQSRPFEGISVKLTRQALSNSAQSVGQAVTPRQLSVQSVPRTGHLR